MLTSRISSSFSTALLRRRSCNYFCSTASTLSSVDTGAAFRETHGITLKNVGDNNSYEPIMSFENAPFADTLKKVLTKEGFSTPTAVQSQSWPIILAKRDVISVARTGSGKTVGFLLPAYQTLFEQKNAGTQRGNNKDEIGRRGDSRSSYKSRNQRQTPKALVLAPTRELAMQIDVEAQKYNRSVAAHSVCLFGGASKGLQIKALRAGAQVIIATPGRCNDLIDMGVLDLSEIEYLVLDEADRMLDMGFEPQIRQIMDCIPEERQTVFFTATWPKEVQTLAMDFLDNPVQINIGEQGVLNANKAIKQEFILTKEFNKEGELFDLLEKITEEGPGHKR